MTQKRDSTPARAADADPPVAAADAPGPFRYRVSEAAALIGVSDDTLRRWADAGRLDLVRGEGRLIQVDGVQLAHLATELAADGALAASGAHRPPTSARNRMPGIVTRVVRDGVMAQVEIQAGPFRVVSLISREAAEELGLEVGAPAAATVKATNVGVELLAPETLTGGRA
ncbi:TOBE domain-containing protein [Clavibacter michiganensis]|uniref:TOBE domain-containing protein n=1 Tax=Clavibacter michiganensis TaxID=28447 RepID=UPI0013652595|nr:TOBE domain-containing protein [Clavibacter michiganensis]MDO4018051.1 TOBE domain-containing protein [Clavibacter michiganensis]MDO4037618.1 TOBE domain-containing protein [Clavibacter michiganensis]MDO4050844.1 TOBE domain-containing protein [Clavibacter michiganensis]MDO4062480.1 TOBE domain-containing protein [Clavibacter michiganensis]MDO4084128.1 TOBE domain-containing protein [Clavibacter michiganensis]